MLRSNHITQNISLQSAIQNQVFAIWLLHSSNGNYGDDNQKYTIGEVNHSVLLYCCLPPPPTPPPPYPSSPKMSGGLIT